MKKYCWLLSYYIIGIAFALQNNKKSKEIKGEKIDEENIIRTIAIFKIANPNSSIRLAGGKKLRLSQKTIELLTKNCVDSTIMGNLLTTTGYSAQEDKKFVEKAGKVLKKN